MKTYTGDEVAAMLRKQKCDMFATMKNMNEVADFAAASDSAASASLTMMFAANTTLENMAELFEEEKF